MDRMSLLCLMIRCKSFFFSLVTASLCLCVHPNHVRSSERSSPSQTLIYLSLLTDVSGLRAKTILVDQRVDDGEVPSDTRTNATSKFLSSSPLRAPNPGANNIRITFASGITRKDYKLLTLPDFISQ